MKKSAFLTLLLCLLTFVSFSSCAKKNPVRELAKALNAKCPMTQKNGATLLSVQCTDTAIVFTSKVPDTVLQSIDVEAATENISASLSNEFKVALLKQKYSVVYSYTTDTDTVNVVIDPATFAHKQ